MIYGGMRGGYREREAPPRQRRQFDHYCAITGKGRGIAYKLVVFTNRKSHTGF